MNSQIVKPGPIALLLVAGAAAQSGSISGTVVDDTGKALGGIPVAYNFIRPAGSRAPLPVTPSSVVSNANGGFTIQGVPAGLYHLCGLASAPGQISSCSRGLPPLNVSVAAGGEASGVKVVIGCGTAVYINATDTAGHIASGKPFRLVAMADGGTFQIARLASQSGSQLQYVVTIPTDRVSRLIVDTDLAVYDQSGAAVAVRQTSAVLPNPASAASAPSGSPAPAAVTLVVM